MTIGMDTFEDAPDAAGGEDVQDAAFAPAYPNAGEWVTGWLLPHYRRNPAVFRWDPRWWQYEEVGSVIEAMWASWEQTRVDPDPRVMATWFRDVFYPLMGQLTSEQGPFWAYNEALDKRKVPDVFPAASAPPGWFG